MKELLKIVNLNKYYGKYHALKDVNLTIVDGEIMGMIGCNGAGKTTLIKCIANLHSFQTGSIFLSDIDVTKNHAAAAEQIGYVPDHDISYNQMTGDEYLQFIAAVYHVSPTDYQKRYDDYVEKFAIDFAMNTLIGSYSHGMKQKIGLIASIIHQPKLWILDEPIVGLDYHSVNSLIQMIKEYNSHGNTILLSSHNLDIVKIICHRYVIMKDGVLSSPHNMDETLTEEDLFKQQKGENLC